MTQLENLLSQFEKALQRLSEVLTIKKTAISRDSAIKRFEISLDLAWKLVKVTLEKKYGVTCQSPKKCFQEAYRQGLIDYDEDWLDLVDMRNETVHVYSEPIAEEIYENLPNALEKFEYLLQRIKELES